jgi:hypothetical protein
MGKWRKLRVARSWPSKVRKGNEPGSDNALGLELEFLFEPLFVSSDLRPRPQPALD